MSNDLAAGYTLKTPCTVIDPVVFEKDTAADTTLFDMSTALNDGEYEATVDGQDGTMTVKLTVAEGKIASVEIVENHETPGGCRRRAGEGSAGDCRSQQPGRGRRFRRDSDFRTHQECGRRVPEAGGEVRAAYKLNK